MDVTEADTSVNVSVTVVGIGVVRGSLAFVKGNEPVLAVSIVGSLDAAFGVVEASERGVALVVSKLIEVGVIPVGDRIVEIVVASSVTASVVDGASAVVGEFPSVKVDANSAVDVTLSKLCIHVLSYQHHHLLQTTNINSVLLITHT